MALTNDKFMQFPIFTDYMKTALPAISIVKNHNTLPPVNNLTFDTNGISNGDNQIIEIKNNAVNFNAQDIQINGVSLPVMIFDIVSTIMSKTFGEALYFEDGNLNVSKNLKVWGDADFSGNVKVNGNIQGSINLQ